jgi:catechol 2,3-dioxygenase-like lactoylglutathione lyase family enzyme
MTVLAPPTSLNHIAYLTFDTEATLDFYTRVMGCRLVGAVQEDRVPSTGDASPFLHMFFSLGNGECIAFFNVEGLEPGVDDGLPSWPRHLALGVDSREELDAWKAHLEAAGLDVVGVTDHHGIWYSIYFFDPNGIRLELTYQGRPLDGNDAEAAGKMVRDWVNSH